MLNGSASAISGAQEAWSRALLVVGDSLRYAAGCEVALINAMGQPWLSEPRECLLSLQPPISPQARAGLL